MEEADGGEQAEDAAEAAGDGAEGLKRGPAVAEEGKKDGDGGGAEDRSGVEAAEPAAAVQGLDEAAKQPEREQVEERAAQAGVEEAVGERLPELAGEKVGGVEAEVVENRDRIEDAEGIDEQEGEEGGEVPQDQAADGAGELGEGELG